LKLHSSHGINEIGCAGYGAWYGAWYGAQYGAQIMNT